MMTKYRNLVNDLDYSFKMDNSMGYKALTFCTLIILWGLVQSILLELQVIG